MALRLKVFTVLFFSILFSSITFSHNTSDLQNIEFDVIRSFEGMNTKTGRIINISASSKNSVRVVGENDWAYVLKVFKNNRPVGGEFYTAKRWARRALNLHAAKHVLEMNRVISEATDHPKMDCCDPNVHDNPQDVTIFDELDASQELPTTQQDYLPGCQSLDVANSSRPRDLDELKRCIGSIQVKITKNARNSRGALLRGKVFRNLYTELNQKEQRFAALVFTAHGEAIPITTGDPPKLQEMSAVMKVVDNRMTSSQNDNKTFNELDVVLDPFQFSMYNRNENVWRRALDPGRGQSLNKAVQAYIEYEAADFEPKPEVNRVYHYHANYVRPNWASNSRAVRLSVNGGLTRPAPYGHNEYTRTGRSRIAKSYRRVRHIFYHDLAWSQWPRTPWRD